MPKDVGAAVARQRQVIDGLGSAIDEFLVRLGEAQLSHSAYERLNLALSMERLLDGLSETLADLARAVVDAGSKPTTRQLTDSVVEGLDAVLLTVVEAMGPDGADDRALLRRMSGDRGALMKRLREEYLASDDSLAATEKMAILTITNLTERAILADQPPGRRASRARGRQRRDWSDRHGGAMKSDASEPTLALRLPNRLAAISEAADEIARFCKDHQVPEAAIGHLNLALDETMTNTIEYAWPDGRRSRDHAHPQRQCRRWWWRKFSTTASPSTRSRCRPPTSTADLGSRPIGGLGVHFVKTLMDEVAYRRDGEQERPHDAQAFRRRGDAPMTLVTRAGPASPGRLSAYPATRTEREP